MIRKSPQTQPLPPLRAPRARRRRAVWAVIAISVFAALVIGFFISPRGSVIRDGTYLVVSESTPWLLQVHQDRGKYLAPDAEPVYFRNTLFGSHIVMVNDSNSPRRVMQKAISDWGDYAKQYIMAITRHARFPAYAPHMNALGGGITFEPSSASKDEWAEVISARPASMPMTVAIVIPTGAAPVSVTGGVGRISAHTFPTGRIYLLRIEHLEVAEAATAFSGLSESSFSPMPGSSMPVAIQLEALRASYPGDPAVGILELNLFTRRAYGVSSNRAFEVWKPYLGASNALNYSYGILSHVPIGATLSY